MRTSLRFLGDPRAWVFIMLGIGGLWLMWIIVAASQNPFRDSSGGATRAGISLDGYVATFPPRPIPNFPLQSGDREIQLDRLAGRLAIIQFHPRRCIDCEAAAQALEKVGPKSGLHVSTVVLKGVEPTSADDLRDIIGTFDSYIQGRRAVTIFYDLTQNVELGRTIDPSTLNHTDVNPFVDQLLVETLRP